MIKTKNILVDEKDWFNIDEEVDPGLRFPEGKALELLRMKFIHDSLELYKEVKKYMKKRKSLSKKNGTSLEETELDFITYYNKWMDKRDEYKCIILDEYGDGDEE